MQINKYIIKIGINKAIKIKKCQNIVYSSTPTISTRIDFFDLIVVIIKEIIPPPNVVYVVKLKHKEKIRSVTQV